MRTIGYPQAALVVRDVAKQFRAGIPGCSATVKALAGVSLTLARGEVTVLVGPPGSGKRTLALCCAGLMVPDDGAVFWSDSRSSSLVNHHVYRNHLVDLSAGRLLFGFAHADDVGVVVVGGALETPPDRARAELRRLLDALGGRAVVLVVAGADRDSADFLPPHVATAVVHLAAGRVARIDRRESRPARVAEL